MVAHASGPHANGKAPSANPLQMYFGGLEALGHTYDPLIKGLARTQLEMLGFANRRAQAYMQIPQQAARCRTPQDFFGLQAQFWRSAYEDYAESIGRVTRTLAACAPSFAALSEEALGSAHDYIAFPEAKEEPVAPRSRERKAA